MEDVKVLNPWLSIWTKPRKTMRQVFDAKPGLIHLLLVLGALVEVLNNFSGESIGDNLGWPMLLAMLIISMFLGYLFNYFVLAPLWTWIGNKLGGVGTIERMRYAIAYSYIPYVFSLGIVWIPSLLLFKMENFTTEMPLVDASGMLTTLFIVLNIINVVIGVWSFVVVLKCVGEAHEFSAWRALGIMLILGAALILLVLLLVVPFAFFL